MFMHIFKVQFMPGQRGALVHDWPKEEYVNLEVKNSPRTVSHTWRTVSLLAGSCCELQLAFVLDTSAREQGGRV